MKKFILLVLLFVMGFMPLSAPAATLEQVKKQEIEKKLNTTQGKQIKQAVDKYSTMYKVDKHLIYAVMYVESGFNPNAKSGHGASGLMQLMPSTFKARNVGTNIFSIDQNIHAGTKHLAGMVARYDGNVYSACAGYNAGGGNVKKGQPIPSYTRGYVSKVFYYKKIMETVQL